MTKDTNRVLLKNIASLGVVQIVNYIFPLITIPFVSRIIGPEGFGLINYITALISYFILIIGFGFDFSATRKIALRPSSLELRSIIYSKVTGARVMLFLICTIVFIILIFNL